MLLPLSPPLVLLTQSSEGATSQANLAALASRNSNAVRYVLPQKLLCVAVLVYVVRRTHTY